MQLILLHMALQFIIHRPVSQLVIPSYMYIQQILLDVQIFLS